MNKKGQSSITDALYFLLIVSGISILLFSFSIGYGSNFSEQIERQFGIEYASSAFKTIFYASVPRIEGESLQDNSTVEIDYLLARIKEDYADNQDLDRTSGALANTVTGIMEPLQANYDYAFYIFTYDSGSVDLRNPTGLATGAAKFVFLMFSLHEPDPSSGEYARQSVVYACKPSSGNALASLDSLLSKVGSVSQSNSWMRLPKLDTSGSARTSTYIAAQVNLAMWISSSVSEDEFNSLDCVACWKNLEGNWIKQPDCPIGQPEPAP